MWTYKEIQAEIGVRLHRLRLDVAHGVSPEEVAARMKEKKLYVAPRTIRAWEAGKGSIQLKKLNILLTYYEISIGDFFRFASGSDEGRLVAAFLDACRDGKRRKALSTLLSTMR